MKNSTTKTSHATKPKTATSKGDHSHAEQAFMKLFEDSLKDIYWVENQLTKAIPKMIANATSNELVAALEDHLAVTQEQVTKVEQVFNIIRKKVAAKKCSAMEGILKEATETMKETEGMVRDAAIICSAQKVEHYEIASYGSLCAFANTLDLPEASAVLKEILEEEKQADGKLTEVAETSVNAEALHEDEG